MSENKAPYLIDQLWIVSTPNKKIRLLALEIDGEIHLPKENLERDRRRDVMLAAMGYEVYHAAGWWCRIDAYRVICEFLNASGIFPNAEKYIIGHEFTSIKDYVCSVCNKPMVRWDWDWLEEVEYRGKRVVTHKNCAKRLCENDELS